MNIVVTGATGLIGRNLVEALLARGHDVLALSRSAETAFAGVSDPALTALSFDLSRDRLEPGTLPEGDVALVMLAASISISTEMRALPDILALDAFGHLRLSEDLGDRLRYGVYASSCTVYGFPDRFPVNESASLAPWNVYALTKCAAEHVLGDLYASRDVPLGILRIAQVYGPGAPLSSALYNFLQIAHAGRPLIITGDAEASRDYCHVFDVLQAIAAALKRRADGVFNVGSGHATRIRDLAAICLKETGRKDQPGTGRTEKSWSMLLDITRAKRDLDYAPEIGIEEGVRREVARLFGKPKHSKSGASLGGVHS